MLMYREQVDRFLAGPVRDGRYILENDPDYPGFYMVRSVPVFSTNRRGGTEPGQAFDEEYLDRILVHHRDLESTRHFVPVFEEHHPDDKFNDSRPKICHMQNLVKGLETVACPDTHQLVTLPTIYSDWRRIKPEYAARFLAGDLEHRSVEIVPGNPRISGCSASSTVPPYFKYGNLIVELGEGVEAPIVKSLRLREPPRADGSPSRMAICFSETSRFTAAEGVKVPPVPAKYAAANPTRFKWETPVSTPQKFMQDAGELGLFIDNTGSLYQLKQSIYANQKRHYTKGQWDREASIQGWMYLVDAGAKAYDLEMGPRGGRDYGLSATGMGGWDAATRRQVAAEYADHFKQLMDEGSDELPRAYRAQQAPARFTGGSAVSKAPKLNTAKFAEAEVEVIDQATGEVIWSGAFADLLAENQGDAEVEGAISAIRGGTSAEVTVGGGANPLRILRKPPGEGVRLNQTAAPAKFAEHCAVIGKVPAAFAGTTTELVAGAWVAEKFTAAEVKSWLDAKVVLPKAASAMRAAGITAAYAARADKRHKGMTFGQAVEARKRPVKMEEAPAEVDPKLVKKAEDAQAEADKAQAEADKIAAEVEAAGGTAPTPEAAAEPAATDPAAAAATEPAAAVDPAAMTPEQKAAKIEELKAELAKLEAAATPPDAGKKDQPTKASARELELTMKLSQAESQAAARDQKDRLDGVIAQLKSKRYAFNENSARELFTTAGVLADAKKTEAFLTHYSSGLARVPTSRLTEDEVSADNGMLAKYAQNPVHMDKAKTLLDSYFADASTQKFQPDAEVFLEQSMKNFFKELRGGKATNGTRARTTAR